MPRRKYSKVELPPLIPHDERTIFWRAPRFDMEESEKLSGYSNLQISQIAHYNLNLTYWGHGQRILSAECLFMLRTLRTTDALVERPLAMPAILGAVDYARQCLTTPRALLFKAEIAFMQMPDGNWRWVLFRDGKPPKAAPEASCATSSSATQNGRGR